MPREAICLSVASYLFVTAVAVAQTPPPTSIYKHPLVGYTVSLPKDAQRAEKGKRRDVVIHSRKGYDIKLQTGKSNPKKPIQAMVAELESLYLGQGKLWARKLGKRSITVGGLVGTDTVYEGLEKRTRMVVVRGRKTVFVFGFSAPSQSFADLVVNFDGLLASFLPGEGEKVSAAPKARAMVPAAAAPKASALKRFTEPELGLRLIPLNPV